MPSSIACFIMKDGLDWTRKVKQRILNFPKQYVALSLSLSSTQQEHSCGLYVKASAPQNSKRHVVVAGSKCHSIHCALINCSLTLACLVSLGGEVG